MCVSTFEVVDRGTSKRTGAWNEANSKKTLEDF